MSSVTAICHHVWAEALTPYKGPAYRAARPTVRPALST